MHDRYLARCSRRNVRRCVSSRKAATRIRNGRNLRPDPQGRHRRQSGRRGRARYRRRRRPDRRHRRSVAQASAGEVIDCRGPARAARRDRHPGAFPRARPRPTRKTWRPARAARCWAASPPCSRCPTPIRPPPAPRRSPTRSRARHHRMHCDFAFFVGGTRENTEDLPELERLPGCCRRQGVHGLLDRLAAGRGRRRRARRSSRRSAAAPRFIPRTNTGCNERKKLRVEGDPRSHPVWRDEIAALHVRRSGWSRLARETGKRVHVLHVSTAEEMEFLARPQGRRLRRGDAAPSHARRAGLLRAARHAARR